MVRSSVVEFAGDMCSHFLPAFNAVVQVVILKDLCLFVAHAASLVIFHEKSLAVWLLQCLHVKTKTYAYYKIPAKEERRAIAKSPMNTIAARPASMYTRNGMPGMTQTPT
ncbi:hypothetical protein NTE_02367 [Candidatus Nitrososphaera evergladensis SR1]|uniref:Uncharacterized protein n=1 Tax=Candidatus Nitrososphaera evergladensis SR1 TaxID=1459636 RepID=A0A075MYS7_9ARCH|nr:hypothetical protein NTE_02367 [Candidatus Nitrososphaera evergladensis SR1]